MKGLHLLLFCAWIALGKAGCPSGAVYNSDNNMCYKFNKDTLSFVDAKSACVNLGGNLASVHNAFVNSEIRCQPTAMGTQCLSATISDGRWYSSSCDVMKAYVCEIPETTSTCPYCPTQVLHNMDFWTAENKCKSLGAHLASIHSFVENNFIERITMSGEVARDHSSYVWIGVNLQNNQWGWTDGTPFDYEMWNAEQPQTGFPCAFFVPDYSNAAYIDKWFANDVCSRIMRSFVCKKKAAY